MKKQRNGNGKVKSLVENLRKLDLINDFMTLWQECRESYISLCGLSPLLRTEPILVEVNNKNEAENLVINQEKICTEYNDIEKSITGPYKIKGETILSVPKRPLEVIEIFNITNKFIELKAEIDKLQISIINFLCSQDKIISEKISQNDNETELLFIHLQNEICLEKALNTSIESNKIQTYQISCNSGEAVSDLKKIGISLPIEIKTPCYSYQIKEGKLLLKKAKSNLTKLLLESEYSKNRKTLEKLSINQERYTRKVTNLTYLIAFLTLLMTVVTVLNVIEMPSRAANVSTENVSKTTKENREPIHTPKDNKKEASKLIQGNNK